MALFFDYQWFDGKLAANGLSRADVAACLSLTEGEVDQLFKDQREMSAADVSALADLLAAPVEEIADRAGVSTPVPRMPQTMEARVAALEAMIAAQQGEVLRLRDQVQGLELALKAQAEKEQM